jgi:YGGT family
MDSSVSPSTKPLYRGTQIVWYVLGVIEILIAFRLVLKLMAANPAAGFSNFIYTVSYPLVAPFMSVFKVSAIDGNVFEWTSLLALFVYWVIAMGIINLFLMGKSVSTPEAAVKLTEQEHN